MMRAIVFSNIAAKELDGKFRGLAVKHGIRIERVVPTARAGMVDLDCDIVLATREGRDADAQKVEVAAKHWGRRVVWVSLRSSDPAWVGIGGAAAANVASQDDASFRELAETYAKENDELHAEIKKLRQTMFDAEKNREREAKAIEFDKKSKAELSVKLRESRSIQGRVGIWRAPARRSAAFEPCSPRRTSS
jgi:cell division protein FtsB